MFRRAATTTMEHDSSPLLFSYFWKHTLRVTKMVAHYRLRFCQCHRSGVYFNELRSPLGSSHCQRPHLSISFSNQISTTQRPRMPKLGLNSHDPGEVLHRRSQSRAVVAFSRIGGDFGWRQGGN
ncbi:hypothetical protein V6N12_042333 [Hibiscus sabdariffa]|uniref:Uncharacterized protein n=1 Tax=Hibiscus sabdariffa TaxID=183260 RepID=A0ABR2EI62_9ROSI